MQNQVQTFGDADQIQCRCFKCPNALETEGSRKVGLGETCEENVYAAFVADQEANPNLHIGGDQLLALLAVYAGDNSNSDSKQLALDLINVSNSKDLRWKQVRKFFMLARTRRVHGDEDGVAKIFSALGMLAPRMTAMALGEATMADGILDYDPEKKQAFGVLTTVRKGSEELCLLRGVYRVGTTRNWIFSEPRSLPAIKEIASIRYPFVKVTDAFNAAVEEAKKLPPLPPEPEPIEECYAPMMKIITIAHAYPDKTWVLTKPQKDDLYFLMTNPKGAIKGSYLKAQSNADRVAYLVEEKVLPEAMRIVKEMIAEHKAFLDRSGGGRKQKAS